MARQPRLSATGFQPGRERSQHRFGERHPWLAHSPEGLASPGPAHLKPGLFQWLAQLQRLARFLRTQINRGGPHLRLRCRAAEGWEGLRPGWTSGLSRPPFALRPGQARHTRQPQPPPRRRKLRTGAVRPVIPQSPPSHSHATAGRRLQRCACETSGPMAMKQYKDFLLIQIPGKSSKKHALAGSPPPWPPVND